MNPTWHSERYHTRMNATKPVWMKTNRLVITWFTAYATATGMVILALLT